MLLKRGESQTLQPAQDFFYSNPPLIGFVDGSHLEGNQYIELKIIANPYDPGKIEVWDWTGIDLQTESQGDAKAQTTVQAKVISELKAKNYNIVFDDDDTGEAADVVAIRLVGDQTAPEAIEVEFYHCKFSGEAKPGHRVKDLYEVCGQAQKSIVWYIPERRSDLFTHLLRREKARQDAGRPTRIELGDVDSLQAIREMSHFKPVRLKVFIVQPGLARRGVPRDPLQLLSVTENHLHETYQIPFGVIASEA